MQSKEKLGITALYCRLSRDDGKEGESNSIKNQTIWVQKSPIQPNVPCKLCLSPQCNILVSDPNFMVTLSNFSVNLFLPFYTLIQEILPALAHIDPFCKTGVFFQFFNGKLNGTVAASASRKYSFKSL